VLRPSIASAGSRLFAVSDSGFVLSSPPVQTAKKNILMIDIGGSNVKLMMRGREEGMVKFPSGKQLRPEEMVQETLQLTRKWPVEAISLGFPGLVRNGRPVREPLNLGGGWMDYDFESALGCPVRMVNDAALQAIAAYSGEGRMLFIGFGTSIGCALVADGAVTNFELGLIPMSANKRFMDRLTKAARLDRGHKKWQKDVHTAVALLRDTFWPDETVIGGGNAKHLDPLPADCRRTSNTDALLGAERLWEGSDLLAAAHGTTWRIERTRKL